MKPNKRLHTCKIHRNWVWMCIERIQYEQRMHCENHVYTPNPRSMIMLVRYVYKVEFLSNCRGRNNMNRFANYIPRTLTTKTDITCILINHTSTTQPINSTINQFTSTTTTSSRYTLFPRLLITIIIHQMYVSFR